MTRQGNNRAHSDVPGNKCDVTAMLPSDSPRNGKAKPDSASLLVPGCLQPEEGSEDLFPHLFRDTWPTILHDNIDAVNRLKNKDRSFVTVPDRIFDDVAYRTSKPVRPAPIRYLVGRNQGYRMTQILLIIAYAADQRLELDRAGFFLCRLAPGERDCSLGHALKLFDRHQHFLLDVLVLDELRPQPESGQWSAQVVTNRSEHL